MIADVTRVPAHDLVELAGLRVTATTRAYREHVLGDCFLCGRNQWCPVETALDAAADIAAHEFGRLRGK